MNNADVTVIGGGMAGIAAALRLSSQSLKVQLVDQGLPEAKGRLGGFAKFSGAKFSLPPAGMGLLPVAGSDAEMIKAYHEVIDEFGLDEFSSRDLSFESFEENVDLNDGGCFRKYHSIILDPEEVDALIGKLSRKIYSAVEVFHGLCTDIIPSQEGWTVLTRGPDGEITKLTSQTVVYAGGRAGSSILKRAGAEVTPSKGIDVGVRVEFSDYKALESIRRLGPDAKILSGNCRTFCLNVPGLIFHYDFDGIRIPGGIVAGKDVVTGNVGILCRVPDKIGMIKRVRKAASQLSSAESWGSIYSSQPALGGVMDIIEKLFGEDVAGELQSFCSFLGKEGLISWSNGYTAHMPLIDWHWDTFGQPESLHTSMPNLFAIGDVSGHARGLLQAAVSGWLLGKEILV